MNKYVTLNPLHFKESPRKTFFEIKIIEGWHSAYKHAKKHKTFFLRVQEGVDPIRLIITKLVENNFKTERLVVRKV